MRKSFVGMWTTLFLASIVSYPAAAFAIVAFVTSMSICSRQDIHS